MGVIDIARTNVVTADPDTPVAEVVRRLHERSVGGLVVVDDGKPLKLITDRDLTIALLDDEFDAKTTPISEFTEGTTPTLPAETGIYESIEFLSERGIRRAILTDEGELAGIISLSDIVVLLGMELQLVANAIRSASPAYEREGPGYYTQ